LQALPYLRATGWLQSRRARRSVDEEMRPIPWITYPAIDFLAERLRPDMTVFEFGSGGSTLWWAERVAHVTCVEHDPAWAAEVGATLPPNVDFHHVELEPGGRYSQAAAESGRRFDVVVVDGRDRVSCALASVGCLREGGVLIWDNSDRGRYRAGVRHLLDGGFRQLKLRGLAPIDAVVAETSVFYRPQNCLGL
jgi:predicted O-methyltransferase YrrM